MMRRGQSNLVIVTIVTALVIGIGLFLWSMISGYAIVYRAKALEEFNAEVLVLRSLISADYVIYPGGEAYIRNIGKEPIVIFRLITLRNGEVVWDSYQVHGVREISLIDVGKMEKIYFECPRCDRDDLVVLQVHYMPVKLYDPSNPELINPTSDVLLFRVASFKAEELKVAPGMICPISDKWAWVDYVNPEESGQTIRNILRVKFSRASELENVLLYARLVDRDGDVAEGEKMVPSISSGEETIELTSQSSLEYPAEIALSIETPNWTLIQNRWILKRDVTAYVDKVMLTWSPYTFRLTGAFITINYNDDGQYKIVVRVYDCNNALIAEGKIHDYNVNLGSFRELYVDYGLELDRNPLMSDVYTVEVYVVDISPPVTVTYTITETTTTTTTSTTTTFRTVPEKTVTNTQTRTLTSTTTRTTTSYTTQTLTTPSTTTTTTVTSTRTSTITSYITTITATTIRTTTSTIWTSLTTTRTTTTAVPGVTRTTTQIVTTTVPTTVSTQTMTIPITSYTTVTTNTITSTTTLYTTITYTRTTTVTTKMSTCPSGFFVQTSDRVAYFLSFSVFLPALCVFALSRRWRNAS